MGRFLSPDCNTFLYCILSSDTENGPQKFLFKGWAPYDIKMNPKIWKQCPDFPKFDCSFRGEIRRRDGKPVILFVLPCHKNPSRKYYSITEHYSGNVHKQVFKAFGPPNPDPERYTLIDHIDNVSIHNHIKNLRWSNSWLNGLNTSVGRFKGYSFYPNAKRVLKYKCHIKWMGSVHTLNWFDNAEEATAFYYACKDFIQREFRIHRYPDKHLPWVFKILRYNENFQPGADPGRRDRARKQFRRRKCELNKHLARYQLESNVLPSYVSGPVP